MPYALRLGLLVLATVRLFVAAHAPLSADEAYYWVWSRALAAGYLDHPPMVALWIRAGTAVAGDTALGVRLLGPASALLGSLLLWRAAEDVAPGRRAGVAAVLLLNATLALNVGAVVMTPDTPLLFFWTAALACLARLVATGRPGWWLAFGACAGLALDSKYTAVLLGLSVLAWLVVTPGARRWFGCWQLWAGAALSLALFAPVLAWNALHGWASFAKQGGRTGDWQPARALGFLAELAGGQIGLATPGCRLGHGRRAGCRVDRAVAARGGAEPAGVRHAAAGLRVPAARAGRQGAGELAGGDLSRRGAGGGLGLGAVLAARLLARERLRARGLRPGGRLALAIAARAGFHPDPPGRLVRPRGQGVRAAPRHPRRLRGRRRVRPGRRPGVPAAHAGGRYRAELGAASTCLRSRCGGHGVLLVRSAREGGPPDPNLWSDIRPLGEAVRGRAGEVAELYRLYFVHWAARPGWTTPAAVLLPAARSSPLLSPP